MGAVLFTSAIDMPSIHPAVGIRAVSDVGAIMLLSDTYHAFEVLYETSTDDNKVVKDEKRERNTMMRRLSYRRHLLHPSSNRDHAYTYTISCARKMRVLVRSDIRWGTAKRLAIVVAKWGVDRTELDTILVITGTNNDIYIREWDANTTDWHSVSASALDSVGPEIKMGDVIIQIDMERI